MSARFPQQVENEFQAYLDDSEAIQALGIFKKDPSVPHLIFTRGVARIVAREYHAALTQKRLIVLPVEHHKGEKVFASPLTVPKSAIDLDTNLFTEPVITLRTNTLAEPLTLRFKAGMRSLGLEETDFIAALKQA
jgi:hypothetical protein